MTPDTYSFTGDATTILGLVGVVSALVIVVTAFRRFFNSPYNVRYSPVKRSGKDLDKLDDVFDAQQYGPTDQWDSE